MSVNVSSADGRHGSNGRADTPRSETSWSPSPVGWCPGPVGRDTKDSGNTTRMCCSRANGIPRPREGFRCRPARLAGFRRDHGHGATSCVMVSKTIAGIPAVQARQRTALNEHDRYHQSFDIQPSRDGRAHQPPRDPIGHANIRPPLAAARVQYRRQDVSRRGSRRDRAATRRAILP